MAVLQGTAASIGRYLVPFICLLGAGMSAWRRAKRRSLVQDATRNDAAGAVARMSWREFEMLVGEAFRLDGYRVVETGGAGADGGVDLELHKGGETFLVQCKQWRAYKVGVEVVRELYGAMAASGAAGGFVVTSGRFTNEARAFASGRNVELVDSERLADDRSGAVDEGVGRRARSECGAERRGCVGKHAAVSFLRLGHGSSKCQTGGERGECVLGLLALSGVQGNEANRSAKLMGRLRAQLAWTARDPRHHFSPNGRTSISKVHADRGCFDSQTAEAAMSSD